MKPLCDFGEALQSGHCGEICGVIFKHTSGKTLTLPAPMIFSAA